MVETLDTGVVDGSLVTMSRKKARHCPFELEAAWPSTNPGCFVPMGTSPPPNFLARCLPRGIAQPTAAPRANCPRQLPTEIQPTLNVIGTY